jgi:ParB family chromosome partitioning protein
MSDNPATVTFSSKGQKKTDGYVREIRLDSVKVISGFNPRSVTHEKEIEVLADSIAKNGLIHPPTVRPTKVEGEFELVSGHRRFRALQTLGRAISPFIVRLDLTEDVEARAFAVAENSADGRTDLTYVELGRAFMDFTAKGWGVAKIASKSGVHSMTVRRALALMEAPETVLELVDTRKLSESAALVFAKLDAKIQNILLSPEFAEKLDGASAHFVRELAKQAQKTLAKDAPKGGEEGKGEEGGKKKGKVKINWRTPSERTEVIRVLAHTAYNPKNEGAEEAREILKTLYWVRGHGAVIGDLSAKEMDALIKGDNEAFNKAAEYKAGQEAKKREQEEAKSKANAAKTTGKK